ncbi:MAG: GtrA family protein [Rhodoferax sp.]
MTHYKTVLRFLLVGIVNTLVGLGVIFAAKGVFGLGDVVSNAIGYGIGLLVSFSLNRYWTFRHTGPVSNAIAIFFVVQAAAYSLNLVCVLGSIEYGIDSYIAQALGMPPYMVISYLGSRYFAFTPGKKLRPGTYVP